MTELIRNWIIGITCAAMIACIPEMLIQKGAVKNITRLAGGLLLLLAAIGPAVKIGNQLECDVAAGSYGYAEIQNADMMQAQLDACRDIIAEAFSAYIEDKADAIGMECSAYVSVYTDEDGLTVPDCVSLYGEWTEVQKEAMSDFLEKDLGIYRENQHFERRGE